MTYNKRIVKLNELCFELLSHSPYIPDLDSSDHWVLADLQEMLQGKRFGSNEEVIAEVEAYFDSKNKSFYKKGIYIRNSRDDRIIEVITSIGAICRRVNLSESHAHSALFGHTYPYKGKEGRFPHHSETGSLSPHLFVEWAQNEIAVVPDFHKRILFSDEAHFGLNGYVNKQNCRIWSEANPQVYVETPLHPEKLTVWCALWAGGILLQKR
ncbi:histone-lysine N-methyltransferase SETMAR [Trichonephila clavipes]|nr:histone-lysine N-methyltransferase SETMAR [Trichonephila clavipes]